MALINDDPTGEMDVLVMDCWGGTPPYCPNGHMPESVTRVAYTIVPAPWYCTECDTRFLDPRD